MIVKYSGPDTKNKMELVQGAHDSDKAIQEKKDKVEKKGEVVVKKMSNPVESNGFIARYWFFSKATGASGYKTDGIEPSIIGSAENINYPTFADIKKISKDFPEQNYAMEWSGKINIIKDGKYTFAVSTDEAAHVWVNEIEVVGSKKGKKGETNGKIELKAGWHDFKATYFDSDGDGNIVVRYSGPDTDNKMELIAGSHDGEIPVIKDAETKKEEAKFAEGFIASYYFFNKGTGQNGYNTDEKKPDLVKELKTIDFKNDAAFKKESKDFPGDHFACEFEGKIHIEKGGKYTFFTASDDGSRLWINEKKVVENWGLHGTRER